MAASMLLIPARLVRGFAAAAVLFLAASCSTTSTDDEADVERPVHEMYNEAADALQDREFETAAGLFNDLDRLHPYSPWATKARIMVAYAHYKARLYDDALIALQRFIQLHPGNRDAAYAYYLRALCHYEQISDVSRDQSMTQRALETLEELVRRFPESDYARDAALKIDLTKDHLAGGEMIVGRYYLRRGHFLAAINRFRRIVESYQTTSQVPEALHRLVEAYTSLGLAEEARKTAAVLGHNYPGSGWYQDSYALVVEGASRDRSRPGAIERFADWIF